MHRWASFLLSLYFFLNKYAHRIMVTAIIGGTPAEHYAFYVQLPKGDGFCGGTVISEQIVLTAAQCLYHEHKGRWATPLEVFVLRGNFSSPNWHVRYYSCEQYVVHSSFKLGKVGYPNPYDIAMVKLVDKIDTSFQPQKPTLQPCKYESLWGHPAKFGTAIGLGLVSQNPETPASQLMEVLLNRDEECGAYNLYHKTVFEKIQICYAVQGRASTCTGDIGGPILLKEEGLVKCMIGISSFNARPCNHPDYPTVFTRIAMFRTWIRRTFNALMKDMCYM